MPANKNVSTILLTLVGGLLFACTGPRMRDSAAPPAAPAAEMVAAPSATDDAVHPSGEISHEDRNSEGQAVRDAGSVKQERPDADVESDPEAMFADYEQQLQLREQQLRGAGISLAHLNETTPLAKTTDNSAPQAPGGTRATKTRKTPKKKASGSNKPKAEPPIGGGATTMCVQICSLKQATCDLEQKICSLATRHSSSERYANVCQRAREDCLVATDACTKCE